MSNGSSETVTVRLRDYNIALPIVLTDEPTQIVLATITPQEAATEAIAVVDTVPTADATSSSDSSGGSGG
ncbi:MAG: hypothetical protein Q9P01_14920 [Anaerolineae bacterium]|nr:hypothetical protein [Anaerolineae bacterium]